MSLVAEDTYFFHAASTKLKSKNFEISGTGCLRSPQLFKAWDRRSAHHYVSNVRVVDRCAGRFARDDLPAGITFLGRPYAGVRMIQLAYAYEQATKHRRPPTTAP
jgi:hypothetical protein